MKPYFTCLIAALFRRPAQIDRIHREFATGGNPTREWRMAAAGILGAFVSLSPSLAEEDTDVSTETCGSDNCDARGVFSVKVSF